MPKLYITTPIFYPNDKPHLGHAYTIVIADILARLGKLLGNDVWLSTGMDEHGQKVAKAAAKAGCKPQAHVDAIAAQFQQLCKRMHTNPDVFVRTTNQQHCETALAFWNQIKPHLYHGKYAGWYLPSDEAFCTEQTADTIWMEEPCIFFRLSAFQDRLLELYQNNPQLITPKSARNEILSIISSGLRDLCVTRENPWGIPVPDPKFPTHTMYVWVDALANYITASPTGKYHPNMVHIIGKDILKFHAIYWPAMLLAAGYSESELPRQIIAHGWWIQGGEKMSKSLGNTVDPTAFLDQYGPDGMRYFLARAKRIESDMEVDWNEVNRVCKQELLGGIGNLGQRLLCMINKYYGAEGMEVSGDSKCSIPEIAALEESASQAYTRRDTYTYTEAVWNATVALNKYISDQEPWKADAASRLQILACALDGWRQLVHWMQPLLPAATSKWAQQINNIPTRPEPVIVFQE